MDDRSVRDELVARLRAVSAALPGVDEKKMFGCEAMFANGAIFALVWKAGRIGVKLPPGERFDALARESGTEPWRAGNKTMAGWLLVPPAIANDPKRLASWVKESHAAALAASAAPKKKAAAPKKKAAAPKRKAAAPKRKAAAPKRNAASRQSARK